jgi:hypothetical protein
MSRLKKVAKITLEEERQLMIARQVDKIREEIEQLAIRADRLSEELSDSDSKSFSKEVVAKLYELAYDGYQFNKLSDKLRDEIIDDADLV